MKDELKIQIYYYFLFMNREAGISLDKKNYAQFSSVVGREYCLCNGTS